MKVTISELIGKVNDLNRVIKVLGQDDVQKHALVDAAEYLQEYRDMILVAKVDVNCQP